MGKVRVKSFDELEEAAKSKRLQERRDSKKEAKKAEKVAQKEENVEEVKLSEQKEEIKEEVKDSQEVKKEEKKTKKEKFQKAPHSNTYNDFAAKVEQNKIYSLSEGLEILGKVQRGKFDETVELHINTTVSGISGNVTLPNGTGKKTRVAIADDKLIAEVEKGVVNFDILVATADMMPKLAKVAKVLGPRGLMPNPKNGTITEKPEDVVKKYEAGQINFKTEAKNPIMHLTVGKMSFGTDKLSENIEAMISAVKKDNIVSIILKSTMSPGIKIRP